MNTKKLKALFSSVNEIREKGDIVFIKFDGVRENDFITIIISYPSNLNREIIRHDGNDLIEVLTNCLNDYYSQNEL
ncbi:hypothetical protein [Flavobacterium lindanitolerans]|uniref:hypothetical protein n=1 Tax=Flavobacterium lindanitolerans TaxID=428988 RepID=UPI0031E3D79D